MSVKQNGHPAFATLDEWIANAAEDAKTVINMAIDEHIPPQYALDRISEYTWSGDVSETGATLKFEIEVFLTPLDD